jgi:hypothetical protein
MVRLLVLVALIIVALSAFAAAADLLKVNVQSSQEASLLRSANADAVMRVSGGYLVVTDQEGANELADLGLETELIRSGLERHQLCVERTMPSEAHLQFPLVYEDGGLRLLLVDPEQASDPTYLGRLLPLPERSLPIVYRQPRVFTKQAISTPIDLDSLIGLCSQDSLESYTYRLQAFYRRPAGGGGSYLAGEWIMSKFREFGYQTVCKDTFWAEVWNGERPCHNIIATKEGSLYPHGQIVVGAHYDGVPVSPAADDNGSGTAGVLEIARVLHDIDTDITFKFVCFDAEETGLDGSWYYSDQAAARRDQILYMFNMDMIANLPNNAHANLFHGDDTYYCELWASIANPLVGINGHLAGTSAYSDHHPFSQHGYPVTFLAEYLFSSVYHTPYDSTTHMNFEYMTRMVQASLATVYTVASETDYDADGVPNSLDNCVFTANTPQADYDDDGVGNECDNCENTANADQLDADGDFIGNVCDDCTDLDGDGYGDPGFPANVCGLDNCPEKYNPDQADADSNGIGDLCDYICGDVDSNALVNISDAVYLINYIFGGAEAPHSMLACDVNCSLSVNISDAVCLINFIFASGMPPCQNCP